MTQIFFCITLRNDLWIWFILFFFIYDIPSHSSHLAKEIFLSLSWSVWLTITLRTLVSPGKMTISVTLALHLLHHLRKPYMSTVIEIISKAELHIWVMRTGSRCVETWCPQSSRVADTSFLEQSFICLSWQWESSVKIYLCPCRIHFSINICGKRNIRHCRTGHRGQSEIQAMLLSVQGPPIELYFHKLGPISSFPSLLKT